MARAQARRYCLKNKVVKYYLKFTLFLMLKFTATIEGESQFGAAFEKIAADLKNLAPVWNDEADLRRTTLLNACGYWIKSSGESVLLSFFSVQEIAGFTVAD